MSVRRGAAAQKALEHLREHRTGEFAVVVCGSTVTPYGDAFSNLDLLVLDYDGDQPSPPKPVRSGGLRYHYFVRPFAHFQRAVAGHEDEALFLLRYGRSVYDPDGRAEALWSHPPSVPEAAWAQKAESSHKEFRRRRASLAWTLRRGQLLLVLDNVTQLLDRALEICCYLVHEPSPGSKWLFQAALRTPLGRQLRPHVLELVASLGELATLGGSYTPRANRVYLAAGEVQRQLEEALRQ